MGFLPHNAMKTVTIAIQIAESIEIKSLKTVFNQRPLVSDNDEIFFCLDQDKYLYAFKYGIICAYNFSPTEISVLKKKLNPALKGDVVINSVISETLEIITEGEGFSTDFDTVTLPDKDAEKLRLVMLNLSHSVALDYYASIAEQLLEDTRRHTSYLEHHGRLNIGGKKLKSYIGKVLNVKNKISENLYIFDSHDAAWDDENLNKLNSELKKKFDLKDRYQIISQQVDIVKENLDLFKDIMFHKESSKLEWIIIILIVIEVIDLVILKIIK